MPPNISLLPSRRGTNTLEAPPHIAASVTSTGTTTPLVSAVQSASPVAASSSAVSDLETLATARKLILPASSVARPVSRWLGPFRRRYPQHHIYQGVQYWEKGFNDIQFVVDNFVDWREKDIVSALVDDSARSVQSSGVTFHADALCQLRTRTCRTPRTPRSGGMQRLEATCAHLHGEGSGESCVRLGGPRCNASICSTPTGIVATSPNRIFAKEAQYDLGCREELPW